MALILRELYRGYFYFFNELAGELLESLGGGLEDTFGVGFRSKGGRLLSDELADFDTMHCCGVFVLCLQDRAGAHAVQAAFRSGKDTRGL